MIMRQITITQFNFEPDIKTFVGQVMAVIDLDADGVHDVRGSAHYLEIPVTDLASGRSIRVTDDPMRWSDLLAETIGYGDIEVAVEDSVKVTFDQPSFEPDIVATEALSALVHER